MSPHRAEHIELDQLREELHELGRRVDALEHRAEDHPILTPRTAVAAGPDFTLPGSRHAIPVAGRAVLGLAGAYLLRALAESGTLPSFLVVGVALLYVAAWLVFSRRTREQDSFAGATYGITAALILTPFLWEATVRFSILSPPASAAILFAFMALSYSSDWSRGSGAVTTVMTVATLVTALVLMIQTGALVPFAAALLAIGCIFEAAACGGHDRKMRAPVAIAADFGIWLIFYTMTRPGGVPEHYKPVTLGFSLALGALLFGIYGSSFVWQIVRRRAISGFEIVQAAVALVLAAGGTLQLTHGRAAASIGVLFFFACAACYVAAFVWLADSSRRAHHVLAWWGAALGLGACFLILPQSLLPLTWGAAAIVAAVIGTGFAQRTLVFHGALYLFAAALTFGLPLTMINAFAGARLEPAPSALWIMVISAAGCYAVCVYRESGRTPASICFVPAIFTAVSAGALLILVVTPRFLDNPTASALATARTVVICALALGFGFTGSRTGHRELVWVSYVAIALCTVKLILKDFRESHAAALAVSLVCYGALLIVAPKLIARSSISR